MYLQFIFLSHIHTHIKYLLGVSDLFYIVLLCFYVFCFIEQIPKNFVFSKSRFIFIIKSTLHLFLLR